MSGLPEAPKDAAHNPNAPLPQAAPKKTRRLPGTRTIDGTQAKIAELRKRDRALNAAVRAKVPIGPIKLNVDTYEAMVLLGEKTKNKINALAVLLIEEALERYIATDRVPEEFNVEQGPGQRPMLEYAGLIPGRDREAPPLTTTAIDPDTVKNSPWIPKSAERTAFQMDHE